MTQIMNEKEMYNVMHEISCYKCCHFRVCFYFRAVQQIVEVPEGAKKFRPFKAEDLAKICSDYDPDSCAFLRGQ